MKTSKLPLAKAGVLLKGQGSVMTIKQSISAQHIRLSAYQP